MWLWWPIDPFPTFLRMFNAHEVKWLTKYIFKDFRWKQRFNILYLYTYVKVVQEAHIVNV